MTNLPPELIERMNKSSRSRNPSVALYETSSGGFVPYNYMTKRSKSLGATTLNSNPSVVHVAETSHWLTKNEVNFL